jgi:hypothetical protein
MLIVPSLPMHYTPVNFNPHEIFPVLISVTGWVNSKTTVQLGGLCQWKIPMTPSGIEPMTWLVAQCLNQQRHRVHHNLIKGIYLFMVHVKVTPAAPSIHHQIVVGQGCKNSRHLVTWATKYFTIAPNIFGNITAVYFLYIQNCVSFYMHQAQSTT